MGALVTALRAHRAPPLLELAPSPAGALHPDGALELTGPAPAAALWALARALCEAPWVASLRARAAGVDALGAAALASWLAKSPPVRALALDENALEDGGALALFDALARAPYAVECVSLRACRAGPSALDGLASLLRVRPPRALDLSENLLAPSALARFARALPGEGLAVRVLRLARCARGPAVADALAEGFATPRPPWRLDLSGSELGAAGLARIASVLALAGAPTELVLDDDRFDADALEPLAAALVRPGNRLRSLSLRGNPLGPRARSVTLSLVSSGALCALHLDRCGLDRATREALAALAVARGAPTTLTLAHDDGLDEEVETADARCLRARAALHARRDDEPTRWSRALAHRCPARAARSSAPDAPARSLAHAAALGPDDFDAAVRVLRVLASPEARALAPERMPPSLGPLIAAAAERMHHDRRALRRARRAEHLAEDRAQVARTAMHRAQLAPRGPAVARALAPDAPALALHRAHRCYACGDRYRALDALYHRLCPPCAAHSRALRDATVDLSGRVAVLTGSRVRVGYQTALKLLRAGAALVATTRFPREAARRFALEPDYEAFRTRFELYGLDLRFPRDVERFAAHLRATLPRLDLLVHNAAQTVARPAGFYAPLVERERAPLALPSDALVRAPARSPSTSDLPAIYQSDALFPSESDDGQGQPLDLRSANSWTLRLGDVSTAELLGAHAVNALAPFVLTNALVPLLEASGPGPRCVVFVTAEEGRFSRSSALGVHPHTNMAKAALNMLVRTSAEELARKGIYLTAVDTGWISSQGPLPATGPARARGTAPPLDEIDGAARVCDPAFRAFRGESPPWGVLLRNFRPSPW